MWRLTYWLPLFANLMLVDLVTAASPPSLVIAGKEARSVIVIRDDWKPQHWSDYGGHAILQRFLTAVTGQQVPIVAATELQAGAHGDRFSLRIWVGRQPQVDKFLGPELDELDGDGFIIRAVGRDVYVSGKFWWSDMWAAYDFMERFAGCRWYGGLEPLFHQATVDTAAGLFDIIPRRDSAEMLSDTNIVEEPTFKTRWMRLVPSNSFRIRNRDRYHDNLVNIFPPEKYVQTNPEYFPLINGKRYLPPSDRRYHFQPCAANPEVGQLMVEAAIQFFKENPGIGSFSLGMNDSDKFCKCEKCLSLAPASVKDGQTRVIYAFFDLYNRVARRLAGNYPDKRLGILAYAHLSLLPEGTIELHPMLLAYLPRDSAQLFDSREVEEFHETAGRWNRMTSQMGISEYMYGGGFVIPRLYDRYLLKNIQERYHQKIQAFYAEDYPNWGLDGPKYWLTSRMLWNHSQDPEALLNEYCTNLFGPGAGAMRHYFELCEETWCTQTLKSNKSNYRWFLDPKQLEIFPPDVCDRIWSVLEDAEKQTQAAEPVVWQRVAYFKDTFAVTRVLSKRYASAQAADSLEAKDKGAGRAVLAEIHGALSQWKDAGNFEGVWKQAQTHKKSIDETVLKNVGGIGYFDRHPVKSVACTIREIMNRAAAAALRRTAGAIRDQIQKIIVGLVNDSFPRTGGWIEELASETGVLLVAENKSQPNIDGRIAEGEWPTPNYNGQFFFLHRLDRQAERTTVRAPRVGNKLYLAFDCQQDPATIGASVTGADRSGKQRSPMVNDDMVVVNLLATNQPVQTIRVNAAGAVGFHQPNWDSVVEAAIGRTDDGWQAEISLDIAKTVLHTKVPAYLSMTRYTRRALPSGKNGTLPGLKMDVATFSPAPVLGSVVGAGNHPDVTTFITGPRLLFVQQ